MNKTLPKVGDIIYSVDRALDYPGSGTDSNREVSASDIKWEQENGISVQDADYLRKRINDLFQGEEVLRVFEDSFITLAPYTSSDRVHHWTREYLIDAKEGHFRWVNTKQEVYDALIAEVDKNLEDTLKYHERALKAHKARKKIVEEEKAANSQG